MTTYIYYEKTTMKQVEQKPDTLHSVFYPFTILYHDNVDLNGFDYAIRISQLIKKNYDNCLYFCCGQGAIGFHLLNKQQVKTITFVDCFEPALDGCKITAKHNGWANSCKFLNDLDLITTPIDLFIADPPWWFEKLPGQQLTDTKHRQLMDLGAQTHKKMWSVLVERLTDNGEAFVTRDKLAAEWNDLIPPQLEIIDEHNLWYFQAVRNSSTVKIFNRLTVVHLQKRKTV
jgi:hypothetical protein